LKKNGLCKERCPGGKGGPLGGKEHLNSAEGVQFFHEKTAGELRAPSLKRDYKRGIRIKGRSFGGKGGALNSVSQEAIYGRAVLLERRERLRERLSKRGRDGKDR